MDPEYADWRSTPTAKALTANSIAALLVSTHHLFNADKDYTRSTLARVHELLQAQGSGSGLSAECFGKAYMVSMQGILITRPKRQHIGFILPIQLKLKRYDVVPG